MSSFISDNREELSHRHYIRKAEDRWLDFSLGKLKEYIRQSKEDFCLVVNCSETIDDAYVIPYQSIKSMLSEETLKNDESRASRWMGTISSEHLLTFSPSGIPLDLSKYHNAFENLGGIQPTINYWAFFANPEIYNVELAIRTLQADTWTIKKSKSIKRGDRVAIWRGTKLNKKGIVGFAEVTSDPIKMVPPPQTFQFYEKMADIKEELRVWIRPFTLPGLPLWFAEDNTGLLKDLSVAKAHGGTVFRIKPKQWLSLMEIVGGWQDPGEPISEEDFNNKRIQKENEIASLSIEELQSRAELAKPFAKKRNVTSTSYERNPYVSEYAKRRANGFCQLCENTAPFSSSKGPYLETHHVEWLSKGGEDTIYNTVAMCPNCHKKMHIVKSNDDKIKLKKCIQSFVS